MSLFVSDAKNHLPDAADFAAALAGFQRASDFFDSAPEIFVARAPGRLDLMGGIADYSGSLVLQRPIREATFVAVQRAAAPTIRIVSCLPAQHNPGEIAAQNLLCEIALDELRCGGALGDYASARRFFRQNPLQHWAAYVVGIFVVLQGERKANFDSGANIYVQSSVPEGKGVSSSAALETATIKAVCAAFNIELEPRAAALLCQITENEIVGAPCGVMDQMTSMLGEKDKLLALRCQPAELEPALEVPPEIEIWGIDSGIRHSVAGADYGTVRAGAFIGYRIIAEIANLPTEKLENNSVKIIDEKWRGYLANLSPAEFNRDFQARLPEKISGAEFLQKYHGTTDKHSIIEPAREYQVLAPTAHPIFENSRVEQFRRLLMLENAHARLNKLGELMFESHKSYSDCGLGSDGTDLLVELIKRAGAEKGLFGAKITGGGSGGTVAVIGRRGADAAVAHVAEQYEQLTNRRPHVFSGTSPGAHFHAIRSLHLK